MRMMYRFLCYAVNSFFKRSLIWGNHQMLAFTIRLLLFCWWIKGEAIRGYYRIQEKQLDWRRAYILWRHASYLLIVILLLKGFYSYKSGRFVLFQWGYWDRREGVGLKTSTLLFCCKEVIIFKSERFVIFQWGQLNKLQLWPFVERET